MRERRANCGSRAVFDFSRPLLRLNTHIAPLRELVQRNFQLLFYSKIFQISGIRDHQGSKISATTNFQDFSNYSFKISRVTNFKIFSLEISRS